MPSISGSSTASNQACGHALDAAVTSTARDLTTGKIDPKDAKANFEKFLYANTSAGFALDKLVLDALVVDQTAKTVTANAHVDAELFFPVFGGSSIRRVAEESAALYSDKTIEVAMMLDITGSMGGQKIADLKTAAYNALDAFLKDQDPNEAARTRRYRALCRFRQHRRACQQCLCRIQVHDFGTACRRRSAGRIERVVRVRRLRDRAQGQPAIHRRQPDARQWSTATIGWGSVRARH